MSYVQGTDRQQALLFPPCLDDYVDAENGVRFIDAFVESLEMKPLGFAHAQAPEGRGRPAYDPKDLLKLYIYGYLHGVRSSRKLERETYRNLEVMWLLKHLKPDHKTIATFRSSHPDALKKVFQEFNQLCRKMDLLGRLVAIDGSVIKADNNISNMDRLKLKAEQLADIDEKIAEYLAGLARGDKAEQSSSTPPAAETDSPHAGGSEESSDMTGVAPEPDAEVLSGDDLLDELTVQKRRCEETIADLESSGKNHQGRNDPDCKLLKKGGKYLPGYNVQIGVEADNHLIVAEMVTDATNDNQHLEPMCDEVLETLGSQGNPIQVVADQGYENHAQMAACEEKGFELHVDQGAQAKQKGLFNNTLFHFDALTNQVICPSGQRLNQYGSTKTKDTHYDQYRNEAACATCKLRSQCTRNEFRTVKISEYRSTSDKIRQRMVDRPEIYARRKGLAEHPFGSIKQWMRQGDFYCCGRGAVDAEFTLSCLGYNLRRLLNIMSVPELIIAAAAIAGGGLFKRFARYQSVICLLRARWGVCSAIYPLCRI